ncbi:MAG TPA: ATP-binding protein [Chitinophagaceae bacterium]|nr:ATP-binding protein [Chitinophagaceae bacterium]
MEEPIKILHLEDTATDAELVYRYLKKAGININVLVVAERASYTKALGDFNPHLVLSDHTLPFFNSVEALLLLQEYDATIPFILVTATVSEEFAVEMIKRGASDYLLKDRLQRLPNAILKALEGKRMEQQHKEVLHNIINSEALMNDAQALAQFGSFDIDFAAGTVKLSNLIYQLFGFTPGQAGAVYQVFYSNTSNNAVDKIRLSIEDVYVDLVPNKNSYTLISKTGRLKFLSAEFKLLKNADGSLTGVKGFLLDVTRLKSAENQLQQSEANLKTIFETTDTGYVLCAAGQQIILFNKKAAAMLEEHSGQPLRAGVPVSAYIPAERRLFVEEIIYKAALGESSMYETSFVNKKGEAKWYFFRWFPITGSNNRHHGIMLAVSDTTERKRMEIELETIAADLIVRNNALEQFAYIVSHNLRAPVANITGIANVLEASEVLTEEDCRQLLDALKTSTGRLDSVVKDLNDILRMTYKTTEQKTDVYIQQLVEEIKAELEVLMQKTGAVIETAFAAGTYLHAVKSFLYCIFYNLIVNSIQFKSPQHTPFIQVGVVPGNSGWELSFSDNGKGIDLHKYGNKIFGLYQKLDTASPGKGMGLCIVKTLVDNMGGKIKVQSKPGNGATFIVTLPNN